MRFFLLILLFILTGPMCYGQGVVEVIRLEKDDGLKDRIVDRVIRDKQGYFIVFQKNTIQRYDGRTFMDIDLSELRSRDVEVRDFQSVEILADGKIVMYVPESEVLFYLNPRAQSITSAPLSGISIVNNGALYILEDSYPTTQQHGLLLHSGHLEETLTTEIISNVILPAGITEVANLDSVFYVSTVDDSLFHIENEKVTKLDIIGKLVQRANGIYVFDQPSIYKITGKEVTKVTDLLDRSFRCSIIKIDQKGNIIAAYRGRERFHDRLYVLDNNDSLHVMSQIVEETDVFKDFHTDDAFYRWMLGGYNGIHVINLMREGSSSILEKPDLKKSDFGAVISGVATNGEEEIVFTKEIQGVFSYDKIASDYNEILNKYTDSGDFERNSKLYYHRKSDAYYSHAYRYDGKSDIYKFTIEDELAVKHTLPLKLNDIYVSDEDELILGGFITNTDTGIIARFNLETEKYEILSNQTPQVRSIFFDDVSRKYWIGTYKGLMIFDESFTLIKTLSKNADSKYKLPIDHIIMCIRYNDKIIAGSYGGGVYIIDPETYEVDLQIDEKKGLTDNSAIGIIEDDIGNCWITTFNGVNVIDSDFNIIEKVYGFEGLPNREFNSKAIAKDGDGIIYSGTINGVSSLDPEKVLQWGKSYGVDIYRVVGYSDSKVDQLSFKDEITLLKAYDSIQVFYNLIDYHIYPFVKENLTVTAEDLNYSVVEKTVTIRDIKLGEYTLKVNTDGSYFGSEVQIIRKLNYPWYLLVLLAILGGCLLVYLIVRKLSNTTKRREAEKTKLNKRISDLQLTSLQSQMNPHFIFNALGAVQYFIQTHNTEMADEYLSNFAMLMRSILESSKSKYIRLSEELRLLELYVGLEKVRFEKLFECDIKVDANVDTEINIPPMVIQPFVENAINHGLYNLKAREGYLLIHFSMPEEDLLILKIKDNGVGRKRAAELRMKKHKSRGTQIVQERLETINNGQELIVTTDTEDIIKNGIVMGTEVSIIIDARN